MELILRLFGLYLEADGYENPMKEFLNKTMADNRKFDSPKAKEFSELFPKTCTRVVELLGERPFSVRGPLNTAILDAVMHVSLKRHSSGLPDDYRNWLDALLSDADFIETTRLATTDTAVVRKRLALAEKFLLG